MNPDEKLPSLEDILKMVGDIIPARDLDNLRVILSMGPVRAAEWLADQEPDDAEYALELIKTVTNKIRDRIQELDVDEEMDLTEANQVINQIRAKL